MKYKLIQKVNPNNREEAPLWYATPITGEAEEATAPPVPPPRTRPRPPSN